MNFSKTYVCFTMLIYLGMVGCAPATASPSLRIPSFREQYPLLLQEAQKWQVDAYLDEAEIHLTPSAPDFESISAGFNSPSRDLESIAVRLYADGKITSKRYIHEYPIHHHRPITLDDWHIDSQAALETMLMEAGPQSLNPEEIRCSSIRLERALAALDQPVMWVFAFWECSDWTQYFYLDANSGNLLDSSAVNVEPTRFPTPPP
jgi:hypothetical protein